MDDKILDLTKQLETSRKKHRKWKKIVTTLAAIVVFCTTYMLILPAITMEKDTICGKEEHIHNESCYVKTTTEQEMQLDCTYDSLGVHVHSSACKDENGHIICGYSDRIVHEHTDMCYDAENELVCELAEVKEHKHTDDCYEVTEEIIKHAHDESCYKMEAGDLICGQEETEATEESEGHTHVAECYEQVETKVCGMEAGDVEDTIVSEPVLACDDVDRAIHKHKDACYDTSSGQKVLICGELEVLEHKHTEECMKSVDVPTADSEELVCEQEEHKHDETCLPEETEEQEIEETQDETVEDEIVEDTVVEDTVIENNEPASSEEGTVTPDSVKAWAEIIDGTTENAEEPMMKSAAAKSSSGTSTYALSRSTSLDLTQWIKDVTMYKKEGDKYLELPNGAIVTEGDLIRFTIDYSIPGQQLAYKDSDGTVHVNSNVVTYKIPEAYTNVKEETGEIRNAAGQVVGTFVIEGNTITMTYNNEYVNENASAKQIHGYISFHSVVTKVTDNEKENQDFEFKDDIILDLNVQESNEAVGDLKVEKLISEINGDIITFQISVSSKEGTKGSVTLTDIMTDLEYVKDSLQVKKGNADVRYTGDISRMTLPEMSAGDTYIITYQAKVDMEGIDSDLTVDNTVTVTGKGSQDQPLEDSTKVTHTFTMLDKTGERGEDGEISWTITVNPDKLDISGWELSDEVNDQRFTGTVTIYRENGSVFAQNAKLPYTFPDGSKDTYIVKYTTQHPVDGSTVVNKATFRGPSGAEITVEKGVGIGSPIKKTGEIAGELQQDANGTWYVPVKWTVTVSTEHGAMPVGTVIYDNMMGYPSGDMYVTYDQMMAIIEEVSQVIEAAGGSVGRVGVRLFREGYDFGAEYSANSLNELKTNLNGRQSDRFERFSVELDKAIPQGKTLVFTYETRAIFANNTVSNETFANRVGIEGMEEVEGRVDFSAGTVKATKYGMDMAQYDPNDDIGDHYWHLDWNNKEGTSQYTYDQLKDNYLVWAIEISIPPDYKGTGDVIMHEDLPEGVSVRELTISYLSDYPSRRLTLKNMQKGNTYNLDINQNGLQAVMEVQVTNAGDLVITMPGSMLQAMAEKAATLPVEEGKTSEWWAYFYICTQINDDFEWPSTSENALIYKNAFENKFTLKDEKGNTLDFGDHTHLIERDESEGNILKSASVKENIVSYQVVLNPDALNLVPNSDVLTVKDTLTYESTENAYLKMQLIPASVKLYEYAGTNADGKAIKGKEVGISYKYDESSVTDNKGTTTRTHIIDFTIPDAKALIFEYEYMATGDKDKEAHKITNTCTIEGVGNGGITSDKEIEIQVVQSSAGADIAGVVLYKVDLDNNGVYLPDAEFHLYYWNSEKKEYIRYTDSENNSPVFKTNASGMLEPALSTDYIAYNQAYYLVEVNAPEGYYLLNEPYYFYVANEDTENFRPNIPEDFEGTELKDKDVIYLKNECAVTEITVRKKWQDYNHGEKIVTSEDVSKVTFELWQRLEGEEGSDKLYGTYTITPDENGNWETTITGLPKGKKVEGKKDGDKRYIYTIKEVSVPNYEVVDYEYDDGDESTDNDADGIKSGTITMTNREVDGYELPETGGIGTTLYTMGGLLLMTAAALFLLLYNKHRKEDITSS